jgi:Outer membrane protein beta-barrel domain
MRRVLSLAALSILALSASASAQRSGSMANPSPEIGVDAGITFGLSDPNVTTIDIPAQHIRMGFFVSPALSIEPMLGLTSISGGGETATIYNIGVGALYHFSASRATNQFYVRPFVNILGFSGGGTSDSQAAFGVGGGLKIPVRDRIATRFEANFMHTDGSDAIGLLAGLSFYTR